MVGSSTSKRRSSRVKRRLSVAFKTGDKSFHGIAMNFSSYGFFLQTSHLFPVGTFIDISLSLKKETTIVIHGKVASARHDQFVATSSLLGGIGVELINPPQEYLNFVEQK